MARSLTAPPQLTILLVALLLLIIGASESQAQEEQPDMAAFMAAMTPGPHHERMAKRDGSWKTHSKMWMQPGAAPMESDGTSVLESVMDGRFVEEISRATMMGMPWEGRGVYGYDNSAKKHIASWYDSFGTAIVNFVGDCDGNCQTISLTGEYFDPMSQSMKTMKTVTVINGENESIVTIFDVDKDGHEAKMVELTYRRDTHENGEE